MVLAVFVIRYREKKGEREQREQLRERVIN